MSCMFSRRMLRIRIETSVSASAIDMRRVSSCTRTPVKTDRAGRAGALSIFQPPVTTQVLPKYRPKSLILRRRPAASQHDVNASCHLVILLSSLNVSFARCCRCMPTVSPSRVVGWQLVEMQQTLRPHPSSCQQPPQNGGAKGAEEGTDTGQIWMCRRKGEEERKKEGGEGRWLDAFRKVQRQIIISTYQGVAVYWISPSQAVAAFGFAHISHTQQAGRQKSGRTDRPVASV
ncbi:hypothetical protein B0T17DRAFT_38443 [Bombardia bombarda]|uniref:Uncharacterized protein n=1 Tax=Bombardia bombarda TaxID=252184 RepID=A0AA40CEH9_9PEZI|nr:hypothetical protein B0T17DRAFT_38443 [Bombardia bombarda]